MSAQSIFNPAAFSFCRKMTDNDRIQLLNNFVQASEIAVAAGFDCIEVHCGHGYLLSQYLSPHLNPGTTLEERLVFPLEVSDA
jgi:anthraniloyl-CoA monooxygenase